jgi:EamA domain-containing membrane protein RarD
MEFFVAVGVRLALLVVAWKLWRWSSQLSARVRWRRRISLGLFFAPLVIWLLGLILPTELQSALKAVAFLNAWIDDLLRMGLGLTTEVGGLLGVALRPLVYAVVYGGLGLLIGWPLDRMSAKPGDEHKKA